jgi:hypothetical protein
MKSNNTDSLDEILLLPADADLKIETTGFSKTNLPMPIVFASENNGMLNPGLRDPVEEDRRDRWHPGSHRTRLLVACLLACKDITTIGRALNHAMPWQGRREIALLTTPLVSLCDNIKLLYDALGPAGGERAAWSPKDTQLYYNAGRRLKKHRDGPIRKIRNKMGAHHDLEMLKEGGTTTVPSADAILPALGDSLVVLLLALNYERIYTWRRRPSNAAADEAEIMTQYPLAARVKLSSGGTVQSVIGPVDSAVIATDPRHEAYDTAMSAVEVYNLLASKAQPSHPTIEIR